MMQVLISITPTKLQSTKKDLISIMNYSEMTGKKYLKNMALPSRAKPKSEEKRDSSRDLKREHRGNSKENNAKEKSNRRKEKLEKPN